MMIFRRSGSLVPPSPLWLKLVRQDAKYTQFGIRRLARRNLSGKEPATGSSGLIVSLTTREDRIGSVHLTLESIASGTVLPTRLILWLDSKKLYDNRSSALKRLEERGVEVRLSKNYGPHTKYYPFIETESTITHPLVTADDDVIYPSTWLQGLAESFRSDARSVSCYRAHVLRIAGRGIAPYQTWGPCRSTTPSALNFATGVSGCIYPPALQKALKDAGESFMRTCPRADDVWLHVNALRAGVRIKQVGNRPLNFSFLPNTQGFGISIRNVRFGENDIQIKSTYGATDIDLLLRQTSIACETPNR
jgi:hypothetical protein